MILWSTSAMKIIRQYGSFFEEAMEYIEKDEYIEVTPKAIRLRKIVLDENERKRSQKSN